MLSKAIRIGCANCEKRGAGKFDALLVRDNMIQTLAKNQGDVVHMKHKLLIWMGRTLPTDHPLNAG